MEQLLWFLLPLAAASGWWAAKLSERRRKSRTRARLNSAYGQGINYLLNEEPDKATDVLVKMVEVDPETVELHLALGSLFRRRGEVDRAIRVHRNIIQRSRLSEFLRNQARLELGRDFLKAGLLDRAESLLQELYQQRVLLPEVSAHLVDLYQQEKEWRKALDVAEQVAGSEPAESWTNRIAHYYCELGEQAKREADYDVVNRLAEQALEADPACARAMLLVGAVCQCRGAFAEAIEVYRKVASQHRELAAEVYADIQFCSHQLDGGVSRLDPVPGVTGLQAAHSESGLAYRCDACGFTGSKLFWQCPGCQRWSSVKPLGLSHAEPL